MKTVACCTPYVPVEWIAAHGLHPQRLSLRTARRNATAAGLRGMCPFAGALVDTAAYYLQLENFKMDQVLESRIYE